MNTQTTTDNVFAQLQIENRDIYALCIGLGRATDPLLTALRQLDPSRFAGDGLLVQSGTNPSVLNAWSTQSQCPIKEPDLVALVIDATDPQARETLPFWVTRLAQMNSLRSAIIIGDDASVTQTTAPAPWRQLLLSSFGAVIDIFPQRRILQHINLLRLTMGLLYLERSPICFDINDLHEVLRAGARARSAATLWNRLDRGHRAFDRLWQTLQPKNPQGAIAFLYGDYDCNPIREFTEIQDCIMDHLPETAWPLGPVAPVFINPHWRPERRVLVLTIADASS
jgi:hypothetical protein